MACPQAMDCIDSKRGAHEGAGRMSYWGPQGPRLVAAQLHGSAGRIACSRPPFARPSGARRGRGRPANPEPSLDRLINCLMDPARREARRRAGSPET